MKQKLLLQFAVISLFFAPSVRAEVLEVCERDTGTGMTIRDLGMIVIYKPTG